MSHFSPRLTQAALAVLLLAGCAATPAIQSPGSPTVTSSGSIPADKIKAIQTKVTGDSEALIQLTKDPKAFFAKEGVTLPANQQVRVLEAGEKLYLILDDRSLQLLQPELNTASDAKNETAQKIAAIRAKATKDSAFKAELLKNPAQTLEKEGLDASVAALMEVVDYQPNVNLLIVAPEGVEISRGTGDAGWNLDALYLGFSNQVSFSQKSTLTKLPSAFYPLTKTILDKSLGQNTPPYKDSQAFMNGRAAINDSFKTKWAVGVDAACTATANLIAPKFCSSFIGYALTDKNFDTALTESFRLFISSPSARLETISQMPNLEKRYTEIQSMMKTLTPRLLITDPQTRPQVMQEITNVLTQLETLNKAFLYLNRTLNYQLPYIYPDNQNQPLLDNTVTPDAITLDKWYFAAQKITTKLQAELATRQAEKK